jgi:cytochrome c biogenesis protein CcmG, thiol:disulfide interchange protein DsbE
MKSLRYVTGFLFLMALGCLPFIFGPAKAAEVSDKEAKDQKQEISIGQIAPDFTVTDLNGNEFQLCSFQGKMPVVIDFWATWCPPCKRELPLVNEFAKTYADKVVVAGVTSDPKEQKDTITKFLADNNYTLPVIHDSDGAVAKEYYVEAIPFLVVIGTDGKVIATHLGYSEGVIEELTKELGLDTATTTSTDGTTTTTTEGTTTSGSGTEAPK